MYTRRNKERGEIVSSITFNRASKPVKQKDRLTSLIIDLSLGYCCRHASRRRRLSLVYYCCHASRRRRTGRRLSRICRKEEEVFEMVSMSRRSEISSHISTYVLVLEEL